MKSFKIILGILFIIFSTMISVVAADSLNKEENQNNNIILPVMVNNKLLIENINIDILKDGIKTSQITNTNGNVIIQNLDENSTYTLRVIDERFRNNEIIIRSHENQLRAFSNGKIINKIDLNIIKSGFYNIENKKTYFNDLGIVETSKLVKVNDDVYYIQDDGNVAVGWLLIGSARYYFNKMGEMQTGWQKISGNWYYLSESGEMQTGWQKVSGYWYYLSESGEMQTGWQKISGYWYYLSKSGEMQTGWQKVSGYWYYLSKSGEMQTGWQKVSGYWYYLSKSGEMQTGWQKVSGDWYYMVENGEMQTGWLYDRRYESWFYLLSSGKMATKWIILNGRCYYFDNSGRTIMENNGKYSGWEVDGSKLIANGGNNKYTVGNNYIVISIKAQHLWLVRERKIIHEMGIISGRPDRPTIMGRFAIEDFDTSVFLRGGEVPAWVKRWIPFYGPYGIHDANWQPQRGFSDSSFYLTRGSHGCVNISPLDIDKIWNNSYKGMLVVVIN